MIGDYVLHHPLTDFAIALLVVAAMIELGRIGLHRPQWAIAVDLALLVGWAGAVVAVGSGLWLVAARGEEHAGVLAIHHWFAYVTLAVASLTGIARFLVSRGHGFAKLKTVGLFMSAVLVAVAGFFGGKMAHQAHTAHGEAAQTRE